VQDAVALGFAQLTDAFGGDALRLSAHAVIAVYMRREDRKHREIVEAIEKHGVPPKFPN